MTERRELRCFCSRHPLLALYGVDKKGLLYVHVRIYKQGRVFGEVIATGDVKILCRDCLRWHSVRITQPGRAVLRPLSDQPEESAAGQI